MSTTRAIGRKPRRFDCVFFLSAFLFANTLTAQQATTDKPDIAEKVSEVYSLIFDDDYAQAMIKADECLRVAEKHSGPDNPDMSGCLNAKALIYASQDMHPEAEALYQRALAIDEKASGPDSVDVADDLDALASIYDVQSHYEKARNYYERVLLIREKALGKEDPEVAESLYNIARILVAQADYRQAESLFLRALEIRDKKLGHEHRVHLIFQSDTCRCLSVSKSLGCPNFFVGVGCVMKWHCNYCP